MQRWATVTCIAFLAWSAVGAWGAGPVERLPLPEAAFQFLGQGAQLVDANRLFLESELMLLDLSTGEMTPFVRELPTDLGLPAFSIGKVGADGFRYVLLGGLVSREGGRSQPVSVLVRADAQGKLLARWTFPTEVFDFDVDADGTVYLAGPADDGYGPHAYRQGQLLWRAIQFDSAVRAALERAHGFWLRWFQVQADSDSLRVIIRDRGWMLDRSGNVRSTWVFQGLGLEDFIDQLVPQSDGGFLALTRGIVMSSDAVPIPPASPNDRPVRILRGRMEWALVRFGPAGQRLRDVGLQALEERFQLPTDALWVPVTIQGERVLLVSRVRREALWVPVVF